MATTTVVASSAFVKRERSFSARLRIAPERVWIAPNLPFIRPAICSLRFCETKGRSVPWGNSSARDV